MTTEQQHLIGTPFTAASTADDVLAGIDLTGRNVVVTGGAGGLGLEATRAMSKAGATVVVAARNPEQAAAKLAGVERVEISRLDLLDPASIDAFAARYLESGRPLHALINGAGNTYGTLVLDARGYERSFAAFHLGHFQLTLALHPALRAAHGARVVNVSSGAHRTSDIRWDDLHFARATTETSRTGRPRPPVSSSPSSWTVAGRPRRSAPSRFTPASPSPRTWPTWSRAPSPWTS
ncbi:SDR family NAD(P)-dependent oxidoreductase [Nocardia sp. BMG111209]|uniref:SDR family NAD(P)-dependent oxidoreductase n=1 Tax=Nocardia sp. BMG111209 TaxID=1160137 RepID=UPI0003A0C0E2|nr:SDR family NAD(P)-dependent oxidoreductase [Nocardia sp. BMG111209]